MLKDFAITLVRTLQDKGHQAYLVGGCVRDLLLRREPTDYDITTDATPGEVMKLFPETYAVGAQFGVVLVPAPKGETKDGETDTVEVATFRSDIGYTDGRHPDQVRFSRDPQEDVARRDFTINGLLLNPMTEEVLDFVGGRADLQAGIIRTIGIAERRFDEDKLRMLRAIRFASRFDYVIEPETRAAIKKFAPKIHQVSCERVREELTKMLTEGHARQAFLLLDETGLLAEVLPEISAMKGVQQPPQFHPEGDVFVHTMLLLSQLPHPCSAVLAWGALLHDVGKPPTFRVGPDRIRFDDHVNVGVRMAERICQRLRFSNTERDQILALVENHMRFGDVERMKQSTFKRFVRMPHFEDHLELHRLDCASSHRDLSLYQFTLDKMSAMPQDEIRPKPLISGRDLIAAGYVPGPRFKKILAEAEDGQLEGRWHTKNAVMSFVTSEYPVHTQKN